MTDPRNIYRQALDQTATIVTAVRPDQLDLPTPCEEWDVRRLLSHVVGAVTRAALIGEGNDAFAVPPFADPSTADWPAAYREAADRAVSAWSDDAKLDAFFAVPWGKVPGRGAVTGYVQEVLVHGWDLAVATGQETELDPSLADFALDFARRALRPENRQDAPFGPVVRPSAGAGPYARLAAWLGRTVPATAG
ncbi:MAG TPA: TIGR03086 family metal-binding protein [Trebonia sp.]|nr:TIGR03086 family metal-binding protein [Trebonia sp.]